MILRSPTEHENGWMCLYFLALLWRERIEVRVVCALHGDPHPYPLPQAGEGVSEFCGSCIAAVSIFEGDHEGHEASEINFPNLRALRVLRG
jgi:hypothetical protein